MNEALAAAGRAAPILLLVLAAVAAASSWPARRQERLRARNRVGAAGALLCLCGATAAAVLLPAPPSGGRMLAAAGAGLAASILGGNALVRGVLELAEPGQRSGSYGRVLLRPEHGERREEVEVLRGGTAIGVLERLLATGCIVLGAPEAIAVLVALKSVGRFGELAQPGARERFIIGSLASLGWAGLAGVAVRLAAG